MCRQFQMEMMLKKISGLGYPCSSHKKRITTFGLRGNWDLFFWISFKVCVGYRIVMDRFKAWLMIVSDLDHTMLPMPKPPTKWKLLPKQKVEQKYLQDPHFINCVVKVFFNCYLRRL
ncbi:uncharacterized protein [Malus domestica]|uniref:uncharacterized protein isoform X2 n=1 Tax=Malus domestica TaxID=3750 RepID=UPI0010AADD23|nr:uncharacterized protein LOC103447294 isoform X3 [Malus domestica]